MSIHEECGVFGVFSTRQEDVASLVYYGLFSLQHRGQESCGIVVNDDGVFTSHKGLGLVGEVFSQETLQKFPQGELAVGHVRYGTTGGNHLSNCQPIQVNHLKGKLAVAHNGNLSNALPLRQELELSGAIFHSTSDTETIAYVITRERIAAPSIQEAVGRAMDRLEGAYRSDPIVMTQVAAVTHWVTSPEPFFLWFWEPSPAAGRKVWVAALEAKAASSPDAYVSTLCRQQLDICR